MKKIPVKTLYLLLFIGIGLVFLGVGSTYAIFTASTGIDNPISLKSDLSYTADIIETIAVEVPAGEIVSSTLNVTNNSDYTLNYIAWYLDEGQDIYIGTSTDNAVGTIANGNSISVVVDILNNSSSTITVILGVSSSKDSVVLSNGMKRVDENIVVGNPLSDFEYYLGSEHSTVTSIKYYGGNLGAGVHVSDAEIPLAENEILLTRYVGSSTSVIVPDVYNVNGVTYNVTALSYAMSGDGYSYFVYWTGIFHENQNIKSVNFGEDIKFIYHEYLYQPVDVDESGNYIFGYYKNVSENNMGSLFSGCTNLVNAPVIPNSVTVISAAFYGCTNLTGTVRINSSNVTNVNNIFYNTSKPITVEVPAGSTTYTKLSASSLPSNVTLNTY